tara:strand:- start:352 stop:774 length:423 start_codon:yes stop_codon:yes gene_type:complete
MSSKNLEKDLESAINFSELTKNKFKNIAQISGLININNPSKLITSDQLRISSNLLYEVFNKYENKHLLLRQSYEEVKKQQLEIERIDSCLQRMNKLDLIMNTTEHPSPFAFPLLVERLNNTLSNETIEERVNKLIRSYEK